MMPTRLPARSTLSLGHSPVQIVRGTNPTAAPGECLPGVTELLFHGRHVGILKRFPQIGSARFMFTKPIQTTQGKTKKLESLESAFDGSFSIVVTGEAGNHADIGVDRVADGHTRLTLDDVVVLVYPALSFHRVNKCKRQRANTQPGSHANGLALRTGNPDRWVGSLHRLRDDVAAGHGKILALIAGIGVHGEHVAYLLGRFDEHLALVRDRDTKSSQFELSGRFASAELHPALGDEVERRNHLRGSRRVVVVR